MGRYNYRGPAIKYCPLPPPPPLLLIGYYIHSSILLTYSDSDYTSNSRREKTPSEIAK